MPTTLDELLASFNLSTETETEKTASDSTTTRVDDVIDRPQGETGMNLADLYLSMQQADGTIDKTAAETTTTADEGEQQLEQVAEAIAEAELDKEAGIKLAAEYDAAGRIMARGFYDELHKLAADTHAVPGPVDKPSSAKTEALGERGVPTMPVNYAGSKDHKENIQTAGPGPKQVYKDVLKDGKKTSVGSGVTMSPPVVGGFATVKDITG